MNVALLFLDNMGIINQCSLIGIVLYFVITHARIAGGEDLTYKIRKARLVSYVLMAL